MTSGSESINLQKWTERELEKLRVFEVPQPSAGQIEVAFPLAGIGKGSTAPTETRLANSFGYAFTIDDDGYLAFEIPNNWDGKSGFTILLHVYINEAYATRSGEIQFQINWAATNEGGTERIDASTHTGTLRSGDINIPATAKALLEIIVGTIPAASLAFHDVVTMLIARIDIDGGTDPVAEPVVIHVEYEYTGVLQV